MNSKSIANVCASYLASAYEVMRTNSVRDGVDSCNLRSQTQSRARACHVRVVWWPGALATGDRHAGRVRCAKLHDAREHVRGGRRLPPVELPPFDERRDDYMIIRRLSITTPRYPLRAGTTLLCVEVSQEGGVEGERGREAAV
jgi:hypothetical protein